MPASPPRPLAATGFLAVALLTAGLAILAALVAAAGPAAARERAPEVIPLPDGFQPEGIVGGRGLLYVGSIPTGAIARVNPRTGRVREAVPAQEGRAAIGLAFNRGLLFAAGGPTGRAFVYDAETGADVADVALTDGPTFVNDVAIGRRAAWFTDSQQPQLYSIALSRRGAPADEAQTLALSGDLEYDDDPQTFELNGIETARGGRVLLAVQSRTGLLFRIDPETGATRTVPLAGGDLVNADGILLRGRTLYVVQNRLDRIAVVRLARDLESGRIVRTITDEDFDVPTTVARLGCGLFAPNARFGTEPTPETEYSVVRVNACRR